MKHIAFLLVIACAASFLFTPLASAQAPQNIEEAQEFAKEVGKGLPGAVKQVWEEQALPVLLGLWNGIAMPLWDWIWQKVKAPFQKELEKRKGIVQEEFEKEKQELRDIGKEEASGLWERFLNLFSQE